MLRTLEERDIRFVRLWFTDVLGALKSVAVAPAELEGAFADGIGFDGSAIEGFARVHEADMIARPDPSTFQLLPWRGEYPGVARMFCDILMPDGSPSYADPRWVLKRNLSKASEMGFTFYTHPEIEFFLLREKPETGTIPVPIDSGGYYDHTPHSIAHDFRRTSITMLEAMGISVEYSHHEGAPGQQEIDLRYADALTTADNIMSFRHEGSRDRAGRLGHVHAQALHRAPRLRHAYPRLLRRRPERLLRSWRRIPAVQTARAFIAAPACSEITAVCNQWVNSYKRRQHLRRQEARLCLRPQQPVRPGPHPDADLGNSTRLEFRSVDLLVPHLAFAVILAAGLEGHRAGLRAPPGRRSDAGADQRRAPRHQALRPTSTRPSRSWRAASSSPKPSASTSSTSSSATSARNGPNTAARSPATN